MYAKKPGKVGRVLDRSKFAIKTCSKNAICKQRSLARGRILDRSVFVIKKCSLEALCKQRSLPGSIRRACYRSEFVIKTYSSKLKCKLEKRRQWIRVRHQDMQLEGPQGIDGC